MERIINLAQQGLRAGWTQAKVRQAVLAHLERERIYLERRKRQGVHTPYDDQTATDQIVLALAVCFLTEEGDGA